MTSYIRKMQRLEHAIVWGSKRAISQAMEGITEAELLQMIEDSPPDGPIAIVNKIRIAKANGGDEAVEQLMRESGVIDVH